MTVTHIGEWDFGVIDVTLRAVLEELFTPEERAARAHFMNMAESNWNSRSISDRKIWYQNIQAAQKAFAEISFRRDPRFFVMLDELFMGPPKKWSGQIASAGDFMAKAHAFWRSFHVSGAREITDLEFLRTVRNHINDLEAVNRLYEYRWTEAGFPLVKISPKFAAASMCSKLDSDVIADLRGPWRAFDIEMPTEEVLYQENSRKEQTPVSHLQVYYGENGLDPSRKWCLSLRSGIMTEYNHRTWMRNEELCSDHGVGDDFTLPWFSIVDVDNRSLMLAGRIVASVICALTNPRYVSEIGRRIHEGWKRKPVVPTSGDELSARIYQVVAPVNIDLVKEVQEYQHHSSSRKSWKLMVQSTVCGHWKMQPHGKGRSERKKMWVRPYRRGPRHAPVAVRPHVIADSEKQP